MILTKKELLNIISRKWSNDVHSVVFREHGETISVIIELKYSTQTMIDYYMNTFGEYSNVNWINSSTTPDGIFIAHIDYNEDFQF